MPTYWVEIDGQSYGPADDAMLLQWAREGRVQPGTVVRDDQTGQRMSAASIGFLAVLFQPPGGAILPGPQMPAYPAPYGEGGQMLAYASPVQGTHTLSHFSTPLVIFLHFVTFSLFSHIHFNLMHGSLPTVRRDDPSAGKAVGFLFIPFFNLYWVFFTYLRLCERIDEQRVLHGLRPSRLNGLAITMLVMQIIPLVNYIALLIVGPIFFGMMRASVNELVAATLRPAWPVAATQPAAMVG